MNMGEKNIEKLGGLNELPPPAYTICAVAISGSRKSKYVVNWALEKFVLEGLTYFKLLHIRPVISRIPTPMGNFIPISQVRDDIAAAFRKEVEWQVTEKLLPYKRMCSQRKVQVEIVQIESDDVATAISANIRKYKINKLVIGASSRSIFSRAQTLSSKISECCPPFCSVYAVSKGKLSSMRPSDSETNTSFGDDSSDTSSSTDNSSSLISSSQTAFSSSFNHKPDPSSQKNALSGIANINFELEKLRIELRHIRGMYAMTQGETIDASRKDCAEREVAERKEAEIRASRETKEKENLENALNGCLNQYRQFTWEEIVSATLSFSDNLKIGMGAYGTVYKCSFQHTTAAVKILHAKDASRNKQFQLELEILSQIRHPHLLILLGACPDRSCLVYEFMENGSLEDRLIRKNNTTPLLWFDRFRIAWEVGSALVFLHNAKPKGIIHRDLKPANILLDRNYVSKIGDVGLSTMVNSDILSLSAAYNDTAPVGTLCYIDPEYQRTGVVSPKSDVYALGIIILQLLTGKPAIALAHKVENAIDNDHLTEMLDLEAGGWPIEETKNLALVALKCTEMRQRDRPDLEDEVLPVLEKLKDFAEKARDLALVSPPPPPKHFTCPILNEVMADPCVAVDGYTYDRVAIEAWLNEKDTSPVTELPLPHKFLTPNYTLLSAIMEWKSGTQT
ncbi:hypothetical protein DH2020_034443 [Rehmannia glutinosa]|uniref:RING-type E3 ubiquitin transferase n=1 Tax=Rehmannia glutinosa TaxID=99300 RepID=A0ABR0V9F5_REHGL